MSSFRLDDGKAGRDVIGGDAPGRGAPGPWAPRVLAGGYPTPALAKDEEERAHWYAGYVRTYLERDLQDIASITSLVDCRRLMRLAALRIGQMLNQSELARDAALDDAVPGALLENLVLTQILAWRWTS